MGQAMAEGNEKCAARLCRVLMCGSASWFKRTTPYERPLYNAFKTTTPCGRPVYDAPETGDEEPVCLMHSKDQNKINDDFQAEFERILVEAENNKVVADFTGFVFPQSDYSNRTFVPGCNFREAEFTQAANFAEATFAREAYFYIAAFAREAQFVRVVFADVAHFGRASFTQDAGFFEVEFAEEANFKESTFTRSADFSKARFALGASFDGTTFAQSVSFWNAAFIGRADFEQAIFVQDVDLRETIFRQGGSFSTSTILGAIQFRETSFRRDHSAQPALDFSDVRVEHPEKVEFYRVDLGQALFHNTNVSEFDFTDVRWRDRGRVSRYQGRRSLIRRLTPRVIWREVPFHFRRKIITWIQKGSKTLCVFDEEIDTLYAGELSPPKGAYDERNYTLIAETYQQLKRNYDAKGDYWTAGHWHYAEMEMKRLHSQFRWKPLRWLSHHFGLVALYKYASAYGESYMMPLLWLILFVAAFAFLYPVPGLEANQPGSGREGWLGYVDRASFFHDHANELAVRFSGRPSEFWSMMVHSLMTSLSVAGFQRELRYAPSYPGGRMMALFEQLLTTTLGGLFLLAIRRQFKRS